MYNYVESGIHVVGHGPTVPDGKTGFKANLGFVFAATIFAAQSDCSISNVVCVTSSCATASKVNTHFRIRIFILIGYSVTSLPVFCHCYQRVT